MFGLWEFRKIAATRGDGLRPEFLRLFPGQPVSEGLTCTQGGIADTERMSPAADANRERSASMSPIQSEFQLTCRCERASQSANPALWWTIASRTVS